MNRETRVALARMHGDLCHDLRERPERLTEAEVVEVADNIIQEIVARAEATFGDEVDVLVEEAVREFAA